jgi:oxaloacetate decarboxylase gamma subunit
MSIIIHKFYPEPKASNESSNSNSGDNKKIIAAITAAIKHHREG